MKHTLANEHSRQQTGRQTKTKKARKEDIGTMRPNARGWKRR